MPHNISADGVIKPHFLTADVKTSIVEENLTVATQMAPAVVRLVNGHNYRHPTSAKADPSPPAASQGFLGRSNVESRQNPCQGPQTTCRDSERLNRRSQ